LTGGLLFPGSLQPVHGQDEWERGKRPYELDWDGRFTDDHVPLVDFEDLEGWTLEINGGSAAMNRSQEQMIWGSYTCRVAYTGDPAGAGFVLRPPEPMMIRNPFTAVNMWVWSDYWIWKGDRGKPMVRISLLLETVGGQSFEIPFSRDLDWPGWYLLHIRLSTVQREAFAQGGMLKGIRLSNCLLDEEEAVFLDNLSFYTEALAPIDFELQPRPGVDLAPGQDLGIHAGKERLPFPTREETLLPENISKNYTTELERDGTAYVFRYLPKTNGKRNDCHERLFLTLSPRFEEVLPTIANPSSPWRSEAARYLVCYNGVEDRESDYAHMKRIARYGMKQVVLLDWESGWRDGWESFTFRTVAAPGKGGDEGQIEYSRNLQELGFRYALYNNFTDLAPVSSHWDEDLITLLPNGAWQEAWFRCYAPKSARVVSMEPAITTIMKDKFDPNAGGPDVHTAITPWMRVDFDARVPGAGTMLTQFYAYGQILLHQQKVWNGPVYSEGGNHYYYCGLVTGNTARDRGYDLANDSWLVDFDLRKLHPLGCDWGFEMGAEATEKEADRFLAGTIAFGHAGSFFGGRGRLDPMTIRSYYMLQQLQSSYCNALIKEIRYANKKGKLLDVSAAIATGAYRRSQIRLEYDNGLVVWINGHRKENWKTPEAELPPSGYYARMPDGNLDVFSAMKNGERIDYVHAPAYDYIDGRGHWVETPWGASDGQLIILKKEDGSRELIPFRTEKFAIALAREPEATIALDMDRNEMGKAKGELRGGMYHIQPVAGAVSYLLRQRPVMTDNSD